MGYIEDAKKRILRNYGAQERKGSGVFEIAS